MERHGRIQFPDALSQPHDSSIVLDGCRFADTDLIMDLKDKAWIIGELKNVDVETNWAQGAGLALRRLEYDLRKVKPTLLFEAEHNTPNNHTIPLSTLTVRRYSDGRVGKIGWILYPKENLGQLCHTFWQKVKEDSF